MVRVIALSTLRDFWSIPEYRDAGEPLRAWYGEAIRANWTQPADIKAQYSSASILKGGRVVFNIKGNDYRLVVAASYKVQLVFVKFVGTHAQYDRIDVQTVEPN